MITAPFPPPLSLYIHYPWCVRKCPYCDFNSHEARQQTPDQSYADALIADLEGALPLVWGKRVQSIFFGGGTPSLMDPDVLADLMARIRMRLPLAANVEITLEANPGTVEAGRFAAFREAGINRLSLGIQSFNDAHLKALGRIHDAAEARRAVELALDTIGNVNLDLMYALPHQSMEQGVAGYWHCDQLRTRAHFGLSPHAGAQHRLSPRSTAAADDDTSAAMREAIEAALGKTSSITKPRLARPGKQCHNRNYWEFGDYLGFSAGAHSKLTLPDRIVRQARTKHPAAYLKGIADRSHIEGERTLTQEDLGFEFMMNALRLTGGIESALFESRTGLPLSTLQPSLDVAIAKGLLTQTPEQIAPTLHGQRFLNELLQLFLA